MPSTPRRSLLIPALLVSAAIAAPAPVAARHDRTVRGRPIRRAIRGRGIRGAGVVRGRRPPAARTIALATAPSARSSSTARARPSTCSRRTRAGTPTCYDECATNWPPLLADDAAAVTAGDGLEPAKITTVDRTDGTKQIKYGD